MRNYQCPEWFRDAKLGIWSHWGPVAAPGGFGGNWYARQMYVQGTREYVHHVQTDGHPSKFAKPGSYELAVKPRSPPKWKSISLKSVILTPREN